MKKILMWTVVIVAIVAVSGIAMGATKTVGFVGYLSDVACGSGGKSADGFNLKREPEKHTVACMTQPDCAASGYGILINRGIRGAKNYMFVKFDQKGNDLAAQLLKKTKKKDHMLIAVQGMQEGDMIKVTSINEVKIREKMPKAKMPENAGGA